MNPLQRVLMFLLRVYQVLVSPVLVLLFGPMGCGCRYHPTCSRYAMDAVREHGALRGTWLTLRRLGRCHPWGGCGDDPVPLRQVQDRLPKRASAPGSTVISLRHGS